MFRFLEASHRPGSGASGRGSLQDDSPQLGARLSSLVRRHERVSSSRTVSNLESLPTLTRAKPHANRSAYWRHCGRPARKCLHVLASPAWALADSSPPAPPPTPAAPHDASLSRALASLARACRPCAASPSPTDRSRSGVRQPKPASAPPAGPARFAPRTP